MNSVNKVEHPGPAVKAMNRKIIPNYQLTSDQFSLTKKY